MIQYFNVFYILFLSFNQLQDYLLYFNAVVVVHVNNKYAHKLSMWNLL